ncbi:phosphosulfolactate synthase [Mycobacterium sp. SM1]|nr:phosphosulfolactate synthase [Mycobacterium sp. SM1]
MWDCPGFLDVPERDGKPRRRGVTHVLDRGATLVELEARLEQAGHLVDVVKIGWGISYVDPMLKQRVALCSDAGVKVCLGGTLLEIATIQGRLDELRRWAADLGVDSLEVSNGLQALSPGRKTQLVRALAEDFTVLAETGAKHGHVPVVADEWLAEMEADLAAGATWVVAEGRESGTVGVYREDGSVRTDLVDAIAARLPLDQVIFEAPRKSQHAWFVRRLGPAVNLGNVPLDEVLPLETLRLGLRADTAALADLGVSR